VHDLVILCDVCCSSALLDCVDSFHFGKQLDSMRIDKTSSAYSEWAELGGNALLTKIGCEFTVFSISMPVSNSKTN
jgi:hypothetical protein